QEKSGSCLMSPQTRIRAVVVLIGFVSLIWQAVAEAQSVTPGNVLLTSTFEAISVRAQFSGDSNGNATATITYRPSGTTTWRNAYATFIDRRMTSGGVTNPYANEARGSIVGLSANKTYEVQVTWSDPNGVSGAQPVVGIASTLSYVPPTGGSIITVTD